MTAFAIVPEFIRSAVEEIQAIGSAVTTASASAAIPTCDLLAAAADEISVAIAESFRAYGQEFQIIFEQLAAFREQFVLNLAGSANRYAQAEAEAAAALEGVLTLPSLAGSAASIPPFNGLNTIVVVGPTGIPIPEPSYATGANNLYIRANMALSNFQLLFTPEELYPITGVKSLPLNQSVALGLTILSKELDSQLAIPGNSVTVFGYSQSAIIASLYMRQLAAVGNPVPVSDLNFVLVGNEMNPNGGLLARFPDFTLLNLGLIFYGATPSDTPYDVAIYTREYDGFADFPRYPLNIISGLNAMFGIATVHTEYLDLPPEAIDNAIQLQTSPGYTGNTRYYMIETEELPLLTPLRAFPVFGRPLAALVEPSLEVIVNLGYGDPYHGYSTSYADVHTPFGLFPEVAPSILVDAFSSAAAEGVSDFKAEMQALAVQPPVVPKFALSDLLDWARKFAEPANFLPATERIVDTGASIISTDYAVLLPLADTVVDLITSLPVYNAQLFIQQLAQGNLVNAIGYPIAADVGLLTVAIFVQLLTVYQAILQNKSEVQALMTPTLVS